MASLPYQELQVSTTTITAAETLCGSQISVGSYSRLTVWCKYAKGDETNVAIIPKFLPTSGGDEYAFITWSATAGARTLTADSWVMSATGNRYIVYDVSGIEFVKIYMDATGGTPTGTLGVYYTVDNL